MGLPEVVLRIVLALVLGALIGTERQYRQRLAGLRTNTLVAIGATLFVILSERVVDEVSPTRMAAQVVSGIGFLGAGVIFREGANVRGLNTAATLWCSGAVGTLVGMGFYAEGVLGTAAILAANTLFRPVTRRINRQSSAAIELESVYRLSVLCSHEEENLVRALILEKVEERDMMFRSLRSEEGPGNTSLVRADVTLPGHDDQAVEQVARELTLSEAIRSVSWEHRE